MNAPRFLKEFANYKINQLKEAAKTGAMLQDIAADRVDRAEKLFKACRRGLISIDETMLEIAKL